MQVTITPPEAAAITTPAQNMLNLMRSLDIDSQELAEYVSGEVRSCASQYAQLDAQRKAITRPLDEAKAKVMDLFRPALEYLDQAKRIGGQKLIEWQRKVEADRRRKQEELEAAARKERERIAREAAEAHARALAEAEELRRKAAEAEAAGRAAEAAKLEARADSKEESGAARAQALEAEAAALPTTVVLTPAPKLSGISSRENWDFEITDLAKIPREYLCLDDKRVRAVVKAMKGQTNIPGIRVFDRGTVAVSR